MILQIPVLIRDLLPNEISDGRMTVARINTTTAAYLVFDETTPGPRWVVRVGNAAKLYRAHHALRVLHDRIPHLVARSIFCGSWAAYPCVQVQSGLAGQPWYRLQQCAPNWENIRRMALHSLAILHSETARNPEWSQNIDPATALRDVVEHAEAVAGSFRTRPIVQCAHRTLQQRGPVTTFVQHGDFCLNNLIFGEASASVIDFDEFGTTSVPLHDEFSLALSLAEFSATSSAEGLSGHLADCLSERLHREPHLADCLEALFVHHLLWRIAESASTANRAAMVPRYEATLEQLERNPQLFDLARRRAEAC